MAPGLTPQEFDLLRSFILKESGITLDESKTYLVETRLKTLVSEYNCASYGELYRQATGPNGNGLKGKIVNAMTTNETLWFRDKGAYRILEDIFLPEMLKQVKAGKQKIRIWSAASSTGQEAYSICMTIHNFCLAKGEGVLNPGHFELVGTDISTEALEISKKGVYDRFSMNRGLPPEFTDRFFTSTGREWVIDHVLRQMVDFRSFNLHGDLSPLGTFDAIFCCNVAIYFSNEAKVALFQKIQNILRPSGIFIIGGAETLSYLYRGFEQKTHENFSYYI